MKAQALNVKTEESELGEQEEFDNGLILKHDALENGDIL